MTVFISWSGPLSEGVATLLNSWLPDVIQGVKTWLSTEDIEKGSIWSSEINEALATSVGVLCVTQENKNAPWLLFEAGGLSKGLTKARVCPLLIDLQPKDLQPPLSLFNLTLADREDIWKLVKTINAADKATGLDQSRLQKSFDHWWPEFEKGLKQVRETYQTLTKSPERSEKEMIVELLEISRALKRAAERAEFREKLAPYLEVYPGWDWLNAQRLDEPWAKFLAVMKEWQKSQKPKPTPEKETDSGKKT